MRPLRRQTCVTVLCVASFLLVSLGITNFATHFVVSNGQHSAEILEQAPVNDPRSPMELEQSPMALDHIRTGRIQDTITDPVKRFVWFVCILYFSMALAQLEYTS